MDLSPHDILNTRRTQLTSALKTGAARLRDLQQQADALSGQLHVIQGCIQEIDLLAKRMEAADAPVLDLTQQPKKEN